MSAPPLTGLGAYLLVLGAERGLELAISRRHTRALADLHSREFGAHQLPILIAVHALYPVALAADVLALGARPPALWPLALVLWLAASSMRLWCMRSLGLFWNVRILVTPGMTRVRRGPYRWLSHPNYLAVGIELIAAPMMFGAWRTALLFGALHALTMAWRVPVENRALAWAASVPEHLGLESARAE